MDKEKEAQQLRKYIIKCCYWYYVKAQPLIPDIEFDKLFKKLQKLEEQCEIDLTSPTQMIYGGLEEQYEGILTKKDIVEPPKQLFSTAKIVLYWNCNMDCSYCCNKLEEVKKTFKPIKQNDLEYLSHTDFELTGGEITLSQSFSCLTELLDNWLPKNRNYYVYTNGVWFNEWHAELLLRRRVNGINVGFHPNQPIYCHTGNPPVILKELAWDRLIKIHEVLIPIRLWVKEDETYLLPDNLPFELKKWRLGDCDEITTDRYYLKG